mmetsp:Transcript_26122/g.78093  ORF Transcript_26122/g.78093 Transcript_26122/m.78093 type:complete len:378 (+) Transcript_26122:411-1544(+)
MHQRLPGRSLRRRRHRVAEPNSPPIPGAAAASLQRHRLLAAPKHHDAARRAACRARSPGDRSHRPGTDDESGQLRHLAHVPRPDSVLRADQQQMPGTRLGNGATASLAVGVGPRDVEERHRHAGILARILEVPLRADHLPLAVRGRGPDFSLDPSVRVGLDRGPIAAQLLHADGIALNVLIAGIEVLLGPAGAREVFVESVAADVEEVAPVGLDFVALELGRLAGSDWILYRAGEVLPEFLEPPREVLRQACGPIQLAAADSDVRDVEVVGAGLKNISLEPLGRLLEGRAVPKVDVGRIRAHRVQQGRPLLQHVRPLQCEALRRHRDGNLSAFQGLEERVAVRDDGLEMTVGQASHVCQDPLLPEGPLVARLLVPGC